MNSPYPDSRKSLRKQLRTARRALSLAQQRRASEQVARRISSHPVFLRSQHIALYMAEDGEIDVQLLIRIAERMSKRCYLPVLHPLGHNHLWFARYKTGDYLRKNYFGLAEPTVDKTCLKPWALDLVLMPLVGFDRHGNRLGMGGGFYDRTFAFLNHTPRNKPHAPVLMGVAHQCQETTGLTREAWDVAFNYVATDKEIIKT
jgi:5-formyltetrahydrofolate cyclo-ligase